MPWSLRIERQGRGLCVIERSKLSENHCITGGSRVSWPCFKQQGPLALTAIQAGARSKSRRDELTVHS
jgi:hypothetical protein